MTSRSPSPDKLDEVLAELEAARDEPAWTPEVETSPRRLVRPPDALREGRWTPSRQVVLLVCLCAALALVVFGVRLLLSSRGGTASAAQTSHVAVSGAAKGVAAPSSSGVSGPSTAAGASGSSSGAATRWSIHVVGAVHHPGVVSVSAGARVSDAVAAAGGLAAGADPNGINLARPLADGEQVHVPRPGEKWTPPADSQPGGSGAGGASAGAGSAGTGPGGGGSGGSVNLNTANLEQLDSLPGVGPVMAQRILDWRTEHGRFSSVDELGEVSGIGDKTLERLRPKVTV